VSEGPAHANLSFTVKGLAGVLGVE
jgi:hypothetical protein